MQNIQQLKKPAVVAVVIWLLLLLGCIIVIGRTSFVADMSAFLPRKPTPEQQLLVGQLRDGIASRFLLAGIEGAPAATLAELSKATAKTLRENTGFVAITNGEPVGQDKDQALIFKQRYLLSPAVNTQLFTAQGLNNALQDSLAEMASSTGLFTKDLLTRDPTGEVLRLVNLLVPNTAPNTVQGVWMNANQTRTTMLIQTKAAGADLDAQEAALQAIQNAFGVAKQQAKGEDASKAQLLVTGPAVFAVSSRETIKGEASRLSTIGTILVILLLYTVYRSLPILLLGLVPVLTGALAGIAAVALSFGSVHGLTLGFGVTLIGEAVDYAIYLFVQYKNEGSTEAQSKRNQTLWHTITLGVLTSICGFCTLLFSGFDGLAQLGLFSIAGVASAALVTRFVLPHVIPANFKMRDTQGLGLRLASLSLQLQKARLALLLLSAACAAFVGLNYSKLWSDELSSLSPVSSKLQALDGQLRADVAAPDVRYLTLIKAPSSELALQYAEALTPQLDALVQAGAISGYESPARYLPSVRTQQARIDSMPSADELRARLVAATQGLPLQASKLEPFVADVVEAKASKPIGLDALQGTSLALAMNALLVRDGQGEQAWTALLPLKAPMKDGSTQDIDALRVKQAIQSAPGSHAVLLDLKGEAVNMYQRYLHEAIVLTLAGLAVIVLLLAVTLRSAVRVWRVCAPLFAAVIIVTATLALLGIPLTLLHLVGLLLVVAVGSNYSLFFDQRQQTVIQHEPLDQSTLVSLLFANMTTMIGFGLLAFSQVPVLKAIGITVGPGAFLALVFSAVLSQRDAH